MKILIGTPIHICKDYAMERWLKNVVKVQEQTLADLLMVDNSPGQNYAETVRKYCNTLGVRDFQIEHFKAVDNNLDNTSSQKIEIAQEIIRRETLRKGYDAWFSWECDQLIPADALKKLIGLMESDNYMMVFHNSWVRINPSELNANMGCALIGKEALGRGWFSDEKEGEINFNLSSHHKVDETVFRRRVLQNGGNYIEVFGIIEPIFHLNS